MERYLQTRFIGSGTYARVYAAIDLKTNILVALKKSEIVENIGIPATSLREIVLLRSMTHQNIVKLLNVVTKSSQLTLVFEYIEYDLKTYISSCKCDLISLVLQLCKGLDYLHARKIVHRDLKPQNILVTANGSLKIADFGLARTLCIKTVLHTEVVTLWYRSPELLNNCSEYDCYIDIWSLGCIICEMKTELPLFPGNNEDDELSMIMDAFRYGMQDFIRTNVGKMPGALNEIVYKALMLDGNERIKAEECVEILQNFSHNQM